MTESDQKRPSSFGERTQAGFEAVKLRHEENPVSGWKLVFLKRGGSLSALLIVLQFLGLWYAALTGNQSPLPGGLLVWALIFAPVLIPLAVVAPDALDRIREFVVAIFPRLRSDRAEPDADPS